MTPTYTKTERFFRCDCGPDGKEFRVDHLMKDERDVPWGGWTCDACGHEWRGTANAHGITATKSAEPRSRYVPVLLKLVRDGSLYVVVPGYQGYYDGAYSADGHQYYFEEHTCPTNIFHDAKIVILGKNDDPHGLFEVVAVGDMKVPGKDDDYKWWDGLRTKWPVLEKLLER